MNELPTNPPPVLTSKILSWALPDELKDPVIGDLNEEFLQRATTGTLLANLWFNKQALHCAWRFLWQTQRGVLMFIFSLIIFFGFILMGMWMAGGVTMYLDVPTALIIYPATIALTIAITSWEILKNAFYELLNLTTVTDNDSLNKSKFVFKVLGNLSMAIGLLTAVLGCIAIGSNLDDIRSLGPALSVVFLSFFYGGVVKILCYVAEKKIQFRTDELN